MARDAHRMRCDLPRIPRNARSLLCATKASATDQSTLSPRPDGTTRLPSRRPRALRGGGSAQPIKGYSSEITARDSLRPRVVKSQPVIKRTRLPHRRRRPPSAAGRVAMPLCKTVARQAIEPSQLPGVLAAGDRRRRTDSGWHWSTLFASGAAAPPSRRTNVDDESMPAAIVSSCTLAGRRSGWRERAHHALTSGGYHSRVSANALVSIVHFAFDI